MSLVHFNSSQDFGKSIIWKIDEGEEFFKNQLLVSELNTKLKSKKQKLEWLSSRYLFKSLANISPYQIIKDEFGKPHFNAPEQQNHLSISHSNGYAAVALSGENIGIDIQTYVEKIYRIKKKFTSESECAKFNDEELNEIQVLHLIWTIKESVFKLYGRKELPFIEGIQIEQCIQSKKTIVCHGLLKKDGLEKDFISHSNLYEKFCFSKARYK